MRKCLECGSELESSTDIVLHICEAEIEGEKE